MAGDPLTVHGFAWSYHFDKCYLPYAGLSHVSAPPRYTACRAGSWLGRDAGCAGFCVNAARFLSSVASRVFRRIAWSLSRLLTVFQ